MEFETLCLHQKNIKDQYGAISMPIYQSATFVHSGNNDEYSYSRLKNPTRRHLENTIAALEGGYDAFAFSTGMAATSTLMCIFKPNDHIIASNDLYGGSLRLFNNVNKENNILFSFVDTSNLDLVKKEIKPNTKAIYLETPSNPLMQVTDILEISKIAKKNNILVIVDNTFLTPYFQRPFELGADIIIHSGTKYLSGHNDTLAGFIVVKNEELAEKVLYYSKTIGANLSPFDSFLIERGIKTLPIRMDRINENTKKVAEYLKNHKRIKKIYYVGFEDSPNYDVTIKQTKGFGGMISIELESEELAKNVLKKIKVFQYAESLGGVDSLITYPMLQTHADVPKEEREKRGINERFLRISVGIENVKDLIEDLKEALE